jgi:hypothetical protein
MIPDEASARRRACVDEIVARFAALPDVVAVALGGSLATQVADARSDVDLYVYADPIVAVKQRATVAAEFADVIELDNGLWEPGDEWSDRETGLGVDLIYRTPVWIEDQLDRILVRHEPSLGYSTCLWHNVRVSQALLDPQGWYARLQQRAAGPYPEALRQAIIAWNHLVLRRIHSSYTAQIAHAATRRDFVSLNHRVAALLASYFDILFALNRVPHPGEKRLVEHALRTCTARPEGMAEDIGRLVRSLGNADLAAVSVCVDTLLDRLDVLLVAQQAMPDRR